MQSVSSRIWTGVAVSISYDNNHYTTDCIHTHTHTHTYIYIYIYIHCLQNNMWDMNSFVYFCVFVEVLTFHNSHTRVHKCKNLQTTPLYTRYDPISIFKRSLTSLNWMSFLSLRSITIKGKKKKNSLPYNLLIARRRIIGCKSSPWVWAQCKMQSCPGFELGPPYLFSSALNVAIHMKACVYTSVYVKYIWWCMNIYVVRFRLFCLSNVGSCILSNKFHGAVMPFPRNYSTIWNLINL